jgi:YggT family protein
MGSPMSDGLNFLINTLFTIYMFVLMLRVLLPIVNADYYNPVSQFVLKLTQPLIAPFKHIIPRTGRLDVAALLILFLFAYLKNWIILSLLLHAPVNFFGLALLAIVQIAELVVQFYFFAIIIQAIISWMQPNNFNPFIIIITQLTEPLLGPARRMIPSIGGLDISPMIVILLLQLINIVVLNPLGFYALQYTVGLLR